MCRRKLRGGETQGARPLADKRVAHVPDIAGHGGLAELVRDEMLRVGVRTRPFPRDTHGRMGKQPFSSL